MIPKQIFLIWLGNDKPKYVDFALNALRLVNPTFKVELMHYTIQQVEERKVDKCLDSAIDFCIKDNRKDRKFIQALANVYRFNLLREYGGIYLDADVFPIKPFDDKLLEKNFDVTRSYNNDEFIFKDVFFVGREKGFTSNKNTRLLYPHNTVKKYDNNFEEFFDLKKKFFDCTLQIGEYFGDHRYNYIDHYNDYTWNPHKCRTPLCKFDNHDT